LVGSFVELVVAGNVSPEDHMLLVFLCPPIEPQDHADSDDIEQTDSALDEEAEKSDKQFAFLSCFMRYINSGKWPPV
jgi:hypothetical protein